MLRVAVETDYPASEFVRLKLLVERGTVFYFVRYEDRDIQLLNDEDVYRKSITLVRGTTKCLSI